MPLIMRKRSWHSKLKNRRIKEVRKKKEIDKLNTKMKKHLFILGCVKDGIALVGDCYRIKQRQRIKEAALLLIVVAIVCIVTVLMLITGI